MGNGLVVSVRRWIAAVLAVGSLAPTGAWAAPGDLDPYFGIGGLAKTSINNAQAQANAVARQTDAKLVSAGTAFFPPGPFDMRFALTRHLPNGNIDTSFGTNGIVSTDFPGGYEEAYAVGIQADGRIIAGGMSLPVSGRSSQLALARYMSNGSLDQSFGFGGLVTSNPGLNSVTALTIDPDGRAIVAGDSSVCCKLAVSRYLVNGALDTTFGVAGVAAAAVPTGMFTLTNAMVRQADGKLVVAGSVLASPTSPTRHDFVLARFDVNGALDTTFGTGGFTVTDFEGEDDEVFGLGMDKSAIIAVGYATKGGTPDFALARYHPNGTLDQNFGTAGRVRTDFGTPAGRWERAFAVLIQKNSDIVAVGTARDDFALARYLSDGTLDTTFLSGQGTVTTDGGSHLLDYARAALALPGGRILAAGTFDGIQTFGLARYMGNRFILWRPRFRVPFIPNVFDEYWWLKYNPVALLAGNALYLPAKVGFASVGAVAGGVAYLASFGNSDVAGSIWRASLGGDYAVTPAMIERRESPMFVGGAPRASAPPSVSIVAVPSPLEQSRAMRRAAVSAAPKGRAPHGRRRNSGAQGHPDAHGRPPG